MDGTLAGAAAAATSFGANSRPVRLARRRGIALIEDSCEALGAGIGRQLETRNPQLANSRKCGTSGDAAVSPNKQNATGEGRMSVADRRVVNGESESVFHYSQFAIHYSSEGES